MPSEKGTNVKVRVRVSEGGGSIFGSSGQTVQADVSLSDGWASEEAVTLLGALTISATTIIQSIVGEDECEEEDAADGDSLPTDEEDAVTVELDSPLGEAPPLPDEAVTEVLSRDPWTEGRS